jgi:hypothetical protein
LLWLRGWFRQPGQQREFEQPGQQPDFELHAGGFRAGEVRALLLEAGFDEVTVSVIEDPDGHDCCVTAVKGL